MLWDPDFIDRNPILGQLSPLLSPMPWRQWPSVGQLNRFRAGEIPVTFIDDSAFMDMGHYYEEAVATGQVPTREQNWHDFFGAVIWWQFPRTKALLNRQHMEDIQRMGVKSRTPRRDRLTHFDECGLVLVAPDQQELETLLREHDWHGLFLEKRSRWQRDWLPFVFGHALYEQALAPFIGLTGKCLVLQAEAGFYRLSPPEQYQWLDQALADTINSRDIFSRPRPLLPLPLLGIPGWWPANEQPEFYANTDYFRPKRNRI
ncbi:DUF3025 domain-containing protein [Zobellella maritima]|uniref:DUF3025 domain-containing protein n=1 Tax=Zobellella maritima TaxID=2059725 RepID=UPI000E30031E|nr:DUF3025 domain-containing protein [Zobellella maritima]